MLVDVGRFFLLRHCPDNEVTVSWLHSPMVIHVGILSTPHLKVCLPSRILLTLTLKRATLAECTQLGSYHWWRNYSVVTSLSFLYTQVSRKTCALIFVQGNCKFSSLWQGDKSSTNLACGVIINLVQILSNRNQLLVLQRSKDQISSG